VITPYLNNSINFCNNESAKDEMRDKMENSIFDVTFNKFLYAMTDGKFINLTENKLQLIDQIDILYKGNEGKMPVSKPIFIKLALNYLGDRLIEFNNLPLLVKQNIIREWVSELNFKIKRQNSTK